MLAKDERVMSYRHRIYDCRRVEGVRRNEKPSWVSPAISFDSPRIRKIR